MLFANSSATCIIFVKAKNVDSFHVEAIMCVWGKHSINLLLINDSFLFYYTDGFGSWATYGCNVTTVGGGFVVCNCNHLTSFSILFVCLTFFDFSSS